MQPEGRGRADLGYAGIGSDKEDINGRWVVRGRVVKGRKGLATAYHMTATDQ